MLCTQCHEVAVPDTVISGSDFAELVGWSCLAVPGWIYCLWRHWNRSKACPSCGSQALMRQSRASLARMGQVLPPAAPTRIRNETGPVRWPAPFRYPLIRLRKGTLGALPGTLALLSWLCGAMGWLSFNAIAGVAGIALLLSLTWVIHNGIRLARLESVLSRCHAWDEQGRSLRIEPL
jgi:hypothetical protein